MITLLRAAVSVLPIAVLLAGCSAASPGPPASEAGGDAAIEGAPEQVIDYLRGSWGCSGKLPGSQDIVTIDADITANTMTFTPSQGEVVSVPYVVTENRLEFDGGHYFELPSEMPRTGETLTLAPQELTPTAAPGNAAGLLIEITRARDDEADVTYSMADNSLDLSCARD